MNILHLIQTSGPGGAEKLLLSLAQNSKGKLESIVGLLKKGWLSEQLQHQGVRVKIIPSGGSFDLKIIRNLVSLIKKEKIDIVHSHLLDMNFYSSIAACFARVPHISTEHGDIHHVSKKIGINTFIKAKAISLFSDKIVFVSDFTRREFLKLSNIQEKKYSIIYNGIDFQEYQRHIDIKKKKEELGVDENEFIIGNVANLYPVKGQIYLLKAVQRLIKEIQNTKLLIIGRGALEDELKREARYLGIDSNVKFLGFREDVKELYKIMDIFVLSSLSEGLPLSLIEAMASKIPVIATNVGGIPEIIDDGQNGFLVSPGDPEGLATKIEYLLKNIRLTDGLIEKGFKSIEQKFCFKYMADKYAKIYLNLSS